MFIGARRKLAVLAGRLNGERGATLVELLVAATIVGVALATFVTALSTGSLSVRELTEETVAQSLAQRQLEQIKNAAYDATGSSYTTVSAPTGYSVAIAVDSSLYTDTNIQKLTVTVSKDSQSIMVVENYKVKR